MHPPREWEESRPRGWTSSIRWSRIPLRFVWRVWIVIQDGSQQQDTMSPITFNERHANTPKSPRPRRSTSSSHLSGAALRVIDQLSLRKVYRSFLSCNPMWTRPNLSPASSHPRNLAEQWVRSLVAMGGQRPMHVAAARVRDTEAGLGAERSTSSSCLTIEGSPEGRSTIWRDIRLGCQPGSTGSAASCTLGLLTAGGGRKTIARQCPE